jgi:glycosyltransferase involved in cell wall biosynthesis
MRSTPRVAFFTDSYHEVNGVALTSREFARFAANREYPFFSVHSGPETRHWREGVFETFELAHSKMLVGLERDLSFDLLAGRHWKALRKQLEAFRPDVVHVTGPSHAGILGVALAHSLRVPLAASWHTNLHEFAGRRLERKLGWLPGRWRESLTSAAESKALDLVLAFYRLARLQFAPNPELVELIARRTRRPTYLMQRGIDTHLFSPSKRTRRDGGFVIGFVGRLSPEKNVRVLRDVERRLKDAGISDYRFLVVGDGSERPWLAQNLERSALPGILRGEPLAEAYANMDAFLFPSETDTFGNVVLEAMASGVPAVVSAAGGPKYLVDTQRNGYVGGNVEEFTQALLELRSDTARREEMAHDARRAAMFHSWESVFDSVYGRYVEIVAPGAPDEIAASPPGASLALAG